MNKFLSGPARNNKARHSLVHGLAGNVVEKRRRGAPVLGRQSLVHLLFRLVARIHLRADLVNRVSDARHGDVGDGKVVHGCTVGRGAPLHGATRLQTRSEVNVETNFGIPLSRSSNRVPHCREGEQRVRVQKSWGLEGRFCSPEGNDRGDKFLCFLQFPLPLQKTLCLRLNIDFQPLVNIVSPLRACDTPVSFSTTRHFIISTQAIWFRPRRQKKSSTSSASAGLV